MRRIRQLILPSVLCALASTGLFVPSMASASAPPAAAGAALHSAQHVRLGQSEVELTGPWKFHTGDDVAWASSSFDDSSWEKMDLSPPADADDPTLGSTGDIPGWTAQGHPGYSGFAWYRLDVDVEGATRTLALKMPDGAEDAYQVFVNGSQIGSFGKFSPHRVTAYVGMPHSFRLPKGIRDGHVTIAIRMWMDSATPFNSADAGGLHGPPVLGYASAIVAEVRLNFEDIAHDIGSGFLELLILFMALLMAVALFWLDRKELAYPWLALVCAVTMLGNSTLLLANFVLPVGQTAYVVLHDVISAPIRIGLWVIFWGYWFRVVRIAKLHYAVWGLVAVLAISTAMLRPPLYGETIPVAASSFLLPLQQISKLGLGVLLFVVAYFGFKRQKAEGGMAAAAILLAFAANFQHELHIIHVSMTISVFGFVITLGQISTILSLLIITVMLLRRFVYSQRRQAEWKLEIEQARHVQQVLIPDVLPEIQGLSIQSEYRPAREVGGDFFQVLPPEVAGTSLIVVGDVAGKGLQAGMLVALIVGAIRNAARYLSDPALILNAVNEQMCERDHANATCIILRISDTGFVDLAHAAHLPPYLNGKEMELEGALPLGAISGIEFPSFSFQLEEGDSLLLMSDGIVEAQDSHGRLFGFDRINEMLRTPTTPAEIATAAQKFGQEDDILVLRVEWTGASMPEAVDYPEFAAR